MNIAQFVPTEAEFADTASCAVAIDQDDDGSGEGTSPRLEARSLRVRQSQNSAAAQSEQLGIRSLRSQVALVASTYIYATLKQTEMLYASVACIAPSIAELLPSGSLFSRVATLHIRRGVTAGNGVSAALEVVREKHSVLLAEIENAAVIESQQRHARGQGSFQTPLGHNSSYSVGEMSSDGRMYMLASVAEMLRQIHVKLAHLEQSQKQFHDLKMRSRALRDALFDVNVRVDSVIGEVNNQEIEPTVCQLCTFNYSNLRKRMYSRCCNQPFCTECASQHARNNSQYGIKTAVQCPLCRAEHKLYAHLD